MYTLSRETSAKRTSGFTLIELLVVVAIIAILAALGLPMFSNAQKKARDSSTKTSVKAYQSVLEQEYSNSNSSSYTDADALVTADDFSNNVIPTSITKNITATAYCISSTVLEVSNSGNCYGAGTGGVCAWSGAGNKNYYCVKNLQ